MKKALITGITGQDGSYLCELLLKKGYEVHGLLPSFMQCDNPVDYPNIGHVVKEIKIHLIDHRDLEKISDLVKSVTPDEIYHFAAISHTQQVWEMPVEASFLSTAFIIALLESVRVHSPGSHLVLPSSAEIFDPNCKICDESTTLVAPTFYSSGKLYSHLTAGQFRERYATLPLKVSNSIMFNHESPRRPATFVTRKITRAAAAIKLGLEEKLVLGNTESKRDWGHARDFVLAMHLMAVQDTGDDFVVATGNSTSVHEFAKKAFNVVGLEADSYIESDPELLRAKDKPVSIGNPEKAKRILGWEPQTSLDNLVEEMVRNDLELLKSP